MCTAHPWRIVLGWVGIIAVLVVVVATASGNLKDEFEIPGSDTQKATDLIESEFAEEQGGVLNLVFAAPPGERLDGRAQGRGRGRDRRAGNPSTSRPRTRPGSRASAIPSTTPISPMTRLSWKRSSTGSSSPRGPRSRRRGIAGRGRGTKTTPARHVTVEFSSDAEFPPIERGHEAARPVADADRPAVVFRAFVASAIPILLALTALATAFILLFILASLTDINTITPLLVSMVGLGVGIDYSLFIVTRFEQLLHEGLSPADAAAEAGASAGRRALRRPDRRDLRHGPSPSSASTS